MWIVITLVSLLLVTIIFLYVPLILQFRLDIHGKLKFSTNLSWLFGLVSREITPGTKERKEIARHRRKPADWGRLVRLILKLLGTEGMLPQIRRLLIGILRQFKVRELIANLKVALDSPSDTGFLLAFTGPLTLLINSLTPYHMAVEPSFTDTAVVEGQVQGTVEVQPVQVIPPVACFIFSLPVFRATKELVLEKWRGSW